MYSVTGVRGYLGSVDKMVHGKIFILISKGEFAGKVSRTSLRSYGVRSSHAESNSVLNADSVSVFLALLDFCPSASLVGRIRDL